MLRTQKEWTSGQHVSEQSPLLLKMNHERMESTRQSQRRPSDDPLAHFVSMINGTRRSVAFLLWLVGSIFILVVSSRWLLKTASSSLVMRDSFRFELWPRTPSMYCPKMNRDASYARDRPRFQPAEVQVKRDIAGFPSFWNFGGAPIHVSYDARSILLNGERVLLLGGSMHPSRATRQTWEAALDEAVHQGLNLITLYVIWATHQPVKGRPLDWTLNAPVGAATTPSCDERRSRANDSRRHCTTTTSSTAAWTLADAIHAAANRGLLVHIRLGPYVCAEYTYGGIPEWVAIEYPDIVMRRANPQWMAVMAEFVTNATAYLKDEQLFSYQGGPIVLAQIENELGEDDVALNEDVSKVSSKIGTPTVQDYADWCGELAQDLVPDVVWTMCFGLSANNTIATYNGFFDDVYWLDMHGDSGRIQVDQPAMWTEAEGGFQIWGDEASDPTDYFWGHTARYMAFATLRWLARGGTHVNYYMWWGGYNRGRSAAAGITNVYASDAPLCPSGQRHHPKFDHFQSLHFILQDVAPVLLDSTRAINEGELLLVWSPHTGRWVWGDNQKKFTFQSRRDGRLREVLFVENASNMSHVVQIPFGDENQSDVVEMAAYSSLILDNGIVVFDSSFIRQEEKAFRRTFEHLSGALTGWNSWREPIGASSQERWTRSDTAPIEQTLLNVQSGMFSDYAWFETKLSLMDDIDAATLLVDSQEANSIMVFVDGEFVGEANTHLHAERNATLSIYIGHLDRGEHIASFLSESLGFYNLMGWGASATRKVKGITGDVLLSFSNQSITLTDGRTWRSFPGLHREQSINGTYRSRTFRHVDKCHSLMPTTTTAPTWSSAVFPTPAYDPTVKSLVLDITKGRGHFWLNGHDLGRYWNITRGTTNAYSQRYYFLPFDLLESDNEWNELVIFDVFGGDHDDKRLLLTAVEPTDNETLEDEVDFPFACL